MFLHVSTITVLATPKEASEASGVMASSFSIGSSPPCLMNSCMWSSVLFWLSIASRNRTWGEGHRSKITRDTQQLDIRLYSRTPLQGHPLKRGHLCNQDTVVGPSDIIIILCIKLPLKCGQLINQDTFSGTNTHTSTYVGTGDFVIQYPSSHIHT